MARYQLCIIINNIIMQVSRYRYSVAMDSKTSIVMRFQRIYILKFICGNY